MRIERTLTDTAVLLELGARLGQRRIALELTQAELAREAGIGKRTLERIEAGASAQLSTFVRILRVLDLLDRLESVLPEPRPSPLALLRAHGKRRQRATGGKRRGGTPTKWTWAEET